MSKEKKSLKDKILLPDEVNTLEEYLEYLEVIGHTKYIKDLEHHKETTVGLYATDKPITDLLRLFWQRSSDACPLEASEAEKQENEFKEWVKEISFKIK